MSATTSLAPRSAMSRQVAAPIPPAPPVTTATRPSSESDMLLPLWSGDRIEGSAGVPQDSTFLFRYSLSSNRRRLAMISSWCVSIQAISDLMCCMNSCPSGVSE